MYVQTGDVNDDEIAATAPVTYAGRPSRANMEVQENDVLVARMKATKKVLVVTAVEKDYLFSTGFAVLRPKTSMISPRFLAYYFRSNGFQTEKDRNAHGATQKAINNSSLERMDIPLPPLDEQATIASALERVDRLLRNRRKADRIATTLTQSVFLNRFGDPSKVKKWPNLSLGELCLLIRDGPHKRPQYQSSGVPFITVHNISEDGFDLDNVFYISPQDHEQLRKRVEPRKGDVLYTKGGTTGIAREVDVDFEFSIYVHVAVLRPKPHLMNPTFLEVALNSKYCKTQAARLTRGIANRDLVLGQMKQVLVPTPPLVLQKRFASLVARVRTLRERQRASGREINRLLDCLMDKAFTGELRIAS